MSEKTNMQLAKALRIIGNLLKGNSGSDKEAEEFLKSVESHEILLNPLETTTTVKPHWFQSNSIWGNTDGK